MSTFNRDPSIEQKHIWNAEQLELQKRHEAQDRVSFSSVEELRYIGGLDLSFIDEETAVACLIVMKMPDLQVTYKQCLETKLNIPYISGYLAFREVGPLMMMLNELKMKKPEIYPQILLIDGNGILHPRQFGIACHLGVLSDTPTIGVAKNLLMIPNEIQDIDLIKKQWRERLHEKGDRMDLVGSSDKRVYGTVLRTSSKNPLFVSQGHCVSLDLAVQVVLAVSIYRIPEPIRMADLESRSYIRNKEPLS